MGFDTIPLLLATVLGSQYFGYWYDKHRPMWPLAQCISRDTLQTLRLFSLVFFNSHGVRSTLCPDPALLCTPLSPSEDKASRFVGLPLITGPSQAYRSDLLTQGYPKMTSSFPMSTIRNVILWVLSPVWTFSVM